VKRILSLGVDYVLVAHFDNHYLNRSVYSFITELFALHPIEIVVGSDFRFGKYRCGSIEDLKEYFRVRVVEKVCCDKGKVISSTRIRELMSNGKKGEAQKLLNW
jgi:FAD synthase